MVKSATKAEADRKRAVAIYSAAANQKKDPALARDAAGSLHWLRENRLGPAGKGAGLEPSLRKAAWWCAVVCCLSTLSLTMTIPFASAQRDKHGCDALCVGSMTSTRSALGLVGGVLVGRLSDSWGRKGAISLGLASGMVGTAVFGSLDSLGGLWLSMLPTALFSHQFLVLKAVVSDWADAAGSSAAARGEAMGILGTAAGVGFMVGPASGGFLFKDHKSCAALSVALQATLLVVLFFLKGFSPPPPTTTTTTTTPTETRHDSEKEMGKNAAAAALPIEAATASAEPVDAGAEQKNDAKYAKEIVAVASEEDWAGGVFKQAPSSSSAPPPPPPASASSSVAQFLSFLQTGVCATGAGRILLTLRFGLALAFHVFNTSFQASLRSRFDFTPKLYSTYLAFAGFTYAMSQAVVSKPVMAKFEKDPRPLLVGCLVLLSGGRALAATALTLQGMFAGTFFVILSLGVVNVAVAAAVSQVASSEEVGGLFGVVEAMESVSGIIGPALGGAVAKWGESYGWAQAPLVAVLGMYSLVACLVALGWEGTVMARTREMQALKLQLQRKHEDATEPDRAKCE
mmetsp:Transcript_20403/g.40476  ORF Transcript_20403/g.40476 Transcript_20403/m.40476 type:complete len:572 (+) Transcript_20403:71-1786(+)